MDDPRGPAAGAVVVALKWVALRPEVDAISGAVTVDDRFAGASAADQAALEWGLRIAAARGVACVAMSVGEATADAILRDALASGADAAIRIDGDRHDAEAVAGSIAHVVDEVQASCVLTGDWSLDRGTGAVAPMAAAILRWPAACGLVSLDLASDGTLRLERRLDGGRRHLLELAAGGRAVLSVEGSTARLRRASLAGALAAKRAVIDVRADQVAHGPPAAGVRTVAVGPYRPRTRILDGPSPELSPRRRVEVLTGAFSDRVPPQRLELDPAAAADRILEQLRAWGELPSGRADASPPGAAADAGR